MSNPYATTKLLYHPDRIQEMREGKRGAPIQIHLMPQNLCNQDCHFCSYRMSNWKNSQLFNDEQQIPWGIMEDLLMDAHTMGVKAIEVTGGGEPLIYKHRENLFDMLTALEFDVGLVTNGTSATKQFIERHAPTLSWVRVSIDAGRVETYAKVRRVNKSHWVKAWNAVKHFSLMMTHPEKRLGVGFVLTNENYQEIDACCEIAVQEGADNIRLSVIFGPEGNEAYKPNVLAEAMEAAEAAEQRYNDGRFLVVNLIRERAINNISQLQDYNPCYTKDLLCVVGGDCNVYTCCSKAFTLSGKIGSLKEQRFKELWESEKTKELFKNFDPRVMCRHQCLYEKRNKDMIDIVVGNQVSAATPGIHRNFI